VRALPPELRSTSIHQSRRRREVVAVPSVQESLAGRRVQNELTMGARGVASICADD
jgi:hypothetical protein